ncbi:MAG: MBOAT family protein [bacterium]|nr:MBOAT family protein [bacterium]
MLINSIKFVVFALIVLVLYYVVPKKFRKYVLLVSSYIFYWLSSKFLSIFIVLSTISIFVSGILLDRQSNKLNIELSKDEKKALKNQVNKKKKIILFFTISFNVIILLVLKYSNFFISSFNSIFGSNIGLVKLLLPLGISYYTLQAISYVIDIYRNKYNASKNFFDVSLFLIYFPIITEGPISRFNELSPQLSEGHSLKYENLINGGGLMLYGYFKKLVIADRCGIFVNNVFGKTDVGGVVVAVAIILYTVQIYAEFSGCMDIISGYSKTLGIDLAKNFERPFFSKDIQEFWRRWHKTLGAWLKDYIFYPISLSKVSMNITKFARKKFSKNLAKFIPVAFSLFFVWFLNGFWHGASWKYVLYGLYYYTIMMIGLLIKPVTDKLLSKLKIKTEGKLYNGFRTIRTIVFVLIGMTLFRSSSISEFSSLIMSIFNKNASLITSFGLSKIDFIVILFTVGIILLYGILEEKNIDVVDKLNKGNIVLRYFVYLVIIFSIIIFGIYGPGYDASDFIYGQF